MTQAQEIHLQEKEPRRTREKPTKEKTEEDWNWQ